jgi:hypothetical protein
MEWSDKRRNLKHRLNGHPNPRKRKKLKRWREILRRQIRERIRFLREKSAETVAKYLEQFKGNRRCFEAVSIMKKSEHSPLRIIDKENHLVHNSRIQFPMIEEFYKSFFNQEDRNTIIEPWTGDPRPLEVPITEQEVATAASKLNNGRAYGKDGTPGELYRYGGPALHKHLATIFNQMFEKQEGIEEIGSGILITLNKLNGKPPIISNTRLITLLNMIR